MTMIARTVARLAAGLVVALSLLAGQAGAQVSSAQKEAVKANCRSDFISHCRGVTPGGADALNCLRQNAAKLTPACRQAVDAIKAGR